MKRPDPALLFAEEEKVFEGVVNDEKLITSENPDGAFEYRFIVPDMVTLEFKQQSVRGEFERVFVTGYQATDANGAPRFLPDGKPLKIPPRELTVKTKSGAQKIELLPELVRMNCLLAAIDSPSDGNPYTVEQWIVFGKTATKAYDHCLGILAEVGKFLTEKNLARADSAEPSEPSSTQDSDIPAS